MAVIVSKDTVDAAVEAFSKEGCEAYVIGEIIAGEDKVQLED